jgi:hypothetical protein
MNEGDTMEFRKLEEHDNPPRLAAGEDAYRIDLPTGRVMHAACWTEVDRDARKASRFGVRAVARAMNADGSPVLTDELQHIIGEGSAAMPLTELIVDGVVDEARRADTYSLALRLAIREMVAQALVEEGAV